MMSRLLLRRSVAHGPLALVYHAVDTPRDTGRSPWSLPLRRFVAHLRMLRDEGFVVSTLAGLEGGPGRRVAITFDDGYRNNLDAAEALTNAGFSATFFVVSDNLGCAPGWHDVDGPRDNLMDAAELRALATRGFEIGSHSAVHTRLTALSVSDAEAALARSHTTLTGLLGRAVESLAYPYGDWNAEVAAAARRVGFLRACTTQSGWALRDGDPFRIRRLSVLREDTPARLARKLASAANAVDWSTIARARFAQLSAR